MSAPVIATCVAIAVFFGLWWGYYLNREVRREAAKKREADARKAHEEAERGREVNRFNNLKRDVYAILTEIVQDPERLRGMRQYPDRHGSTEFDPLRRFLTSHSELRNGLERIKYIADSHNAACTERRAMQGAMKDIQKALGMGQPIDFPHQQ